MNSEDTGRSVDGNTEPVDRPSAAGGSVPTTPKRRMSKLNRWLIRVGAFVLLLAIVAGTVVTVLLHRAEPMCAPASSLPCRNDSTRVWSWTTCMFRSSTASRWRRTG